MEYKPHDYQQFAINYILEHPIAAVILGMGLGKTSITLTAIEQLIYDSFEVSKVLVVAPLRVARNTWSDEIHKWNHLKHLRYPVYMNDEEAKLYADMEEDLFIPLKKGEITAANAAALSGKLLQMANGAVYSDDGDEIVIHDQKLDALEDMIEAANGRPVMVAYWFKHDLSRIMRRLTEKKIPFEKLDSEESIRKWNRGELQVALIHPASAGHGLNLQSGGNMLIWFGLTWSLELYQQTVARLWRQGQTSETVVVQHIITAGTIDEDVMKALASKDMTQNRLIAAVKARVTHGR